MIPILQSVVGGPGPLIVEYDGQVFIEKCFIISNKHVTNIENKLKNVQYSKVLQTTDRSFILT
jgi:hypothetical protein